MVAIVEIHGHDHNTSQMQQWSRPQMSPSIVFHLMQCGRNHITFMFVTTRRFAAQHLFLAHILSILGRPIKESLILGIKRIVLERSLIGGERNKPLGFLTLGQGSWRKKIEEEEVYFVFSGSSLVVYLHLMF